MRRWGEDCPQVVMSTGSPFTTEFENGNGFTIDDMIGSAWFVVPSNTNGLPDEDGRVLLAQLTTDGHAVRGVVHASSARWSGHFGRSCGPAILRALR